MQGFATFLRKLLKAHMIFLILLFLFISNPTYENGNQLYRFLGVKILYHMFIFVYIYFCKAIALQHRKNAFNMFLFRAFLVHFFSLSRWLFLHFALFGWVV